MKSKLLLCNVFLMQILYRTSRELASLPYWSTEQAGVYGFSANKQLN